MSAHKKLLNHINAKQSFLCVGLDPDEAKLPTKKNGSKIDVLHFCKKIIDETANFCVAYKPNTAFFEALGSKGWRCLEQLTEYISIYYPEHFLIADAKRGDIGNTAEMYARCFFDSMPFDAVTLSPYMGLDSLEPFLRYKNKMIVVLGLTSNKGADDFEKQQLKSGILLYEKVIKDVSMLANYKQIMFVAGATRPEEIKNIRALVPYNFLLIPGVGAQGGDLIDACKNGMNSNTGILINVGRSILYASKNSDFAEKAGREAEAVCKAMQEIYQGYFNVK